MPNLLSDMLVGEIPIVQPGFAQPRRGRHLELHNSLLKRLLAAAPGMLSDISGLHSFRCLEHITFPCCDNPKCLQLLPNIPRVIKVLLHWGRGQIFLYSGIVPGKLTALLKTTPHLAPVSNPNETRQVLATWWLQGKGVCSLSSAWGTQMVER